MPNATQVKMDARDPDLSRIREIARESRSGKIIGFPTETVYGIGGPMSVKGLSEKLIAVKGRAPEKPFSYHIADWEMVDLLDVDRTPIFRYFSRKFWPGPVTLIVRNKEGKKIGLRYPQNLIAAALINATGEPFIATSANISNDPSPNTAEMVIKSIGPKIDFLIDAGPCEIKEDSTVVDISGSEPNILREGAQAEEVREAIDKVKSGDFPRKKILIVCTGNSCRSPMAEGWLKSEVAKSELSGQIEISSCGVGTRDGMPATPEAVFVMKNREIDISEHRSRICRKEDVVESDIIICMSQNHYTFITSLVPSARSKIKVLDIVDPIGSPMSVYENVMDEIEDKLEEYWDWLIA